MGCMLAAIDGVTCLIRFVAGITCQRACGSPADYLLAPFAIAVAVVCRTVTIAVTRRIGRHLAVTSAVGVEDHLDIIVKVVHYCALCTGAKVAITTGIGVVADMFDMGTAAYRRSIGPLAAVAAIAGKQG